MQKCYRISTCALAMICASALALTTQSSVSANSHPIKTVTDDDVIRHGHAVVIGYFTGGKRVVVESAEVVDVVGENVRRSKINYVSTYYGFRVVKLIDGVQVPEFIEIQVRGGASANIQTPALWNPPPNKISVGLSIIKMMVPDAYAVAGARVLPIQDGAEESFLKRVKSIKAEDRRQNPLPPLAPPSEVTVVPMPE
jgi:hypothetical protein